MSEWTRRKIWRTYVYPPTLKWNAGGGGGGGDVAGVCTRRRFKRRDDRVRVVEPTPKILSPGPDRAHLFFPLTSYLLLQSTILFYFIYFSFSDVTWKSNCWPGWSRTLIANRLATARAGLINRSAISHVAHTHLSPAVTDLNGPSTLRLSLSLRTKSSGNPGRVQKNKYKKRTSPDRGFSYITKFDC
jgi:hypothetical protein